MIRAATLYAASRGLSESPLRFDVISVDGKTLRHEPGAFDADGS
jgi:Holliday junction resolvase-like predicted endonuclease